jgi:hypothetical protein
LLELFFNFIGDSAKSNLTDMKNSIYSLLIVLLMLIINSCAPVKFYSNDGLTEKTGLKYYTVKPFLHVERDAETNRIVKATVVYLPDLAHPQYMIMHDGLNSRKLNLKFDDGTINTFGYASVSKVDGSVDALASLITKSTDAATELTAIKSIQPVKAPSNTVEFYEIVFGTEKTTLRKVEIGQ